MIHKKFQNVISVLFLFAFVAMIPACTQLTANQTGEVTLNINAREADSADPSLAAVTQKKLTVTVQGDYNTTKTIDFADKAQVTFKRIPVGAKISVQADLFINDQKSYTGTSNTFVVKGRKNSVQLVLKRIQAEGQEEQEEPEEPVERNLLKVNPALGETIQGAIAKIKEINDSAEDYVIEVTGAADEYNIVIDENVPAHSITLRGVEQASETQEHNGITRNTRPSEGSSVLRVSGPISVVIKNFEFNVQTFGIEGDGAVINVGNGATVTLENGALLTGTGSVTQSEQEATSSNGVVAVEDGGLLIMKTGSTICNFQIKRGAVYVKNGGTFIMDGGRIAGITSFGSGSGAFIKSKGTFRMSSGDITGNSAKDNGGGVCMGGIAPGLLTATTPAPAAPGLTIRGAVCLIFFTRLSAAGPRLLRFTVTVFLTLDL